MNVDGEKREEITDDGDLDTEGGKVKKVKNAVDIRSQKRNYQHHIGHPQMNMVQEEISKSLTEDRIKFQTSGIFHHPNYQTL